MEGIKRRRLRQRILRAERVAKGLCLDCGRMTNKGATRCPKHLLQHNQEGVRNYDKRRVKRQTQMKAKWVRLKREGRCVQCGVVLNEEESVTCVSCKVLKNESMRRGRRR